jgi:site-specific DNA-methyltransferase (cytosine-N4-specific)
MNLINNNYSILSGSSLETLKEVPSKFIQCCVTSPPYWGLRDYGHDDQIGGEDSPDLYIDNLVNIFSEVNRVLKDNGTLWLNIGDSYASYRDSKCTPQSIHGDKSRDMPTSNANNRNPKILKKAGIKHKELCGIPWKLAFALQKSGWYLRQDIIWFKENPMPESVQDRCTRSHEYIFLLTKKDKYFYNNKAIKEPSKDGGYKNKRDVWTINPSKFKGNHFATFPEELVLNCILAGSSEGDYILDPFSGSGTTGVVSLNNGRKYIGCELNTKYIEISHNRIKNEVMVGRLF